MVGLPAGINEAALISALAITLGVVGYSFAGGMIPSFTYSNYLLPIFGIALIALGLHWDHFIGDAMVGFGAGLSGATLKALIPSTTG